jgi:hypothetical protein
MLSYLFFSYRVIFHNHSIVHCSGCCTDDTYAIFIINRQQSNKMCNLEQFGFKYFIKSVSNFFHDFFLIFSLFLFSHQECNSFSPESYRGHTIFEKHTHFFRIFFPNRFVILLHQNFTTTIPKLRVFEKNMLNLFFWLFFHTRSFFH